LKLIGRIADDSTETKARVILLKDLENEVVSEELVIIKNGGHDDYQILGVLREGLGKNEFLNYTSYKPDIAYMKYGGEPSGAREVYSFSVQPIGVITNNGIEPNRKIIRPRSPVYLLDDNDNPFELISKGVDVLWLDAFLDRHEKWKIPVNKTFIPYHVGVYGSTGSGKSWFTRYILIPLYIRTGYKVLILDWSGTDYAPYYRNLKNVEVINITDVSLDEESVLSYFKEKTNDFAGNDNIEDAFDEFIVGWKDKVENAIKNVPENKRPHEILYAELKTHVNNYIIKNIEQRWRNYAERAKNRVFRKFKDVDLLPIMGTVSIEELLKKFEEGKRILVIDMSGLPADAKLSFFSTLANYLYKLMEMGSNVNIALVIDEAPQYAPWSPDGLQRQTTEMIKNLAALGRKRMLNLTLIAQGIKGEIGINASVRRNLNTHFFGRIHPLDAGGEGGASEWLSPYGITPDHMLQLNPGKFYFSGAMNLSPVPLLITYKPSLSENHG
jgi:DNA helicase HerA-like ATPase